MKWWFGLRYESTTTLCSNTSQERYTVPGESSGRSVYTEASRPTGSLPSAPQCLTLEGASGHVMWSSTKYKHAPFLMRKIKPNFDINTHTQSFNIQ